jgi:hypothetical protein
MSRVELVEELYWESPGDLFALTTGGDFPAHMHVPVDILNFKGTELDRAACACMRLRDKSGKVVGFGSELEVLPPLTNEDGPVDVYFTIVLPGRGSLLLQEYKRHEDLTSEATSGAMVCYPTCGPGQDGKSVLLFGTGEFEGVQGSHHQEIHIAHITPDAPSGSTHKVRNVETLRLSLPKR